MRALLSLAFLVAVVALPHASADSPPCDADASWILRPPTFWIRADCGVASADFDSLFGCDLRVLDVTADCPWE